MQSLTQPELLLKPFAESGDKNTLPVTNTDASNPQLADLTNGFPQVTSEDPDDGGLPPERKDINGLGYLTTTYDYFYQAGGTFTFSPTISTAIGGYPLGARLWYTDSNGATTVVRSTIANNTDNFNDGSATGIGTTWVPEIPALGWNNTWTGNNTFSGQNTFSEKNTFSDEIISTNGNAIRFVGNGYGKIFHQSSAAFYLLLTNQNDEYGSYNSLRPFSVNLSNGVVTTTPNSATHGIVTTEAISKSSNGYVKLGNGMIIQWGRFSTSSYTQTGTITFPTAFSNTNYSLSFGSFRIGQTGYGQGYFLVTDATSSNFTYRLVSGSDYYANQGRWIAIGY